MEYSVDWLSFSIPRKGVLGAHSFDLASVAENSVRWFFGIYAEAIADGQTFTPARAKNKTYSQSWQRADGGVMLFADRRRDTILIEISGEGCKTLRKHDSLEEVLAKGAERLSRIDLAVDIVTAVTPQAFAEERDVKRFKNTSDIKSETGDTYYVGSWKSKRFARVYRYSKPHPRSASLRVEHVFRGRAAKEFGRALLAGGYASAVLSVGRVYGWSHSIWEPEKVEPIKFTSGQVRKTDKNTVFWLYGAVASAMAKAIQRGDVDLNDWLAHLNTIKT